MPMFSGGSMSTLVLFIRPARYPCDRLDGSRVAPLWLRLEGNPLQAGKGISVVIPPFLGAVQCGTSIIQVQIHGRANLSTPGCQVYVCGYMVM